jgi:REP element-mobilizing transposase RayT
VGHDPLTACAVQLRFAGGLVEWKIVSGELYDSAVPASPTPKAYFLTWRTYGNWLPGDARGYVDRTRNRFGEAFKGPNHRLEAAASGQMSGPPIVLGTTLRSAGEVAMRTVCEEREWTILGMNVRTNHVHIVLSAEEAPARIMTALKARATRDIRMLRLEPPGGVLWARGGSKRILWQDADVEAAVDYVVNRQ